MGYQPIAGHHAYTHGVTHRDNFRKPNPPVCFWDSAQIKLKIKLGILELRVGNTPLCAIVSASAYN